MNRRLRIFRVMYLIIYVFDLVLLFCVLLINKMASIINIVDYIFLYPLFGSDISDFIIYYTFFVVKTFELVYLSKYDFVIQSYRIQDAFRSIFIIVMSWALYKFCQFFHFEKTLFLLIGIILGFVILTETIILIYQISTECTNVNIQDPIIDTNDDVTTDVTTENIDTNNISLDVDVAINNDENNKYDTYDIYACCICADIIQKRYISLPCGHAQYCDKCIENINKCSICNKVIKYKFRVYL